MDLAPGEGDLNQTLNAGDMCEKLRALITECSFTITVEATDPLTRRSCANQDHRSLGVGPGPLPYHYIIDQLHVIDMDHLWKVGLRHSACVLIFLYANMPYQMKP